MLDIYIININDIYVICNKNPNSSFTLYLFLDSWIFSNATRSPLDFNKFH